MDENGTMAQMRALAHPVRIRIVSLLANQGPARATDLGDALGLAPNAVSYHLKSLAKAGLVEQAPEASADKRERWWRASHGDYDLLQGRTAVTPTETTAETPAESSDAAHAALDQVGRFVMDTLNRVRTQLREDGPDSDTHVSLGVSTLQLTTAQHRRLLQDISDYTQQRIADLNAEPDSAEPRHSWDLALLSARVSHTAHPVTDQAPPE